jgi:hypothetical protein
LLATLKSGFLEKKLQKSLALMVAAKKKKDSKSASLATFL